RAAAGRRIDLHLGNRTSMRARAAGLIRFTLLVAAGLAAGASARDPRSVPPDEDRFLNRTLPDIALTTARGQTVTLASISRGRPLLFTFVFTRCAGVCSPFLASWRTAERSIVTSRPFHRLVLSFDPRDTPDDLLALAHHLGVEASADWTFAVAAPRDVRR